jgi:hypothetical protein
MRHEKTTLLKKKKSPHMGNVSTRSNRPFFINQMIDEKRQHFSFVVVWRKILRISLSTATLVARTIAI